MFKCTYIHIRFYLKIVNKIQMKKQIILYLYRKNDFAEVSKNLIKYRFENNFVRSSK